MAPAWLSSTLGSPAWCQAAINCSYGLLCLTNDDAGYKVMYGKDDKPDKAALGMARFDGLELCKSGFLLLASSDAPKSFRPTINGVVALNALADVGMTEWQKRHAGLDEKQARISQCLSLGIGAFAAYSAWRESRSEDECEECREEARKTARKASPAVQRVRIGAGN